MVLLLQNVQEIWNKQNKWNETKWKTTLELFLLKTEWKLNTFCVQQMERLILCWVLQYSYSEFWGFCLRLSTMECWMRKHNFQSVSCGLFVKICCRFFYSMKKWTRNMRSKMKFSGCHVIFQWFLPKNQFDPLKNASWSETQTQTQQNACSFNAWTSCVAQPKHSRFTIWITWKYAWITVIWFHPPRCGSINGMLLTCAAHKNLA